MSEYKRKKFKHHTKRKKLPKNNDEVISMSNKKNAQLPVVPEDEIKVIRGKKIKRKRITKILAVIVAIIVITCIVLSFVLPVGLYENIINLTAQIGQGSYPITISGSTVINSVSNGSYYFLLTDTNIAAYSNNGKIIFDELHGFSNPIMSVSETRVLIYDQGGKNAYIYNLDGLVHSVQTEHEILTASISRNGDFAIATHSNSITSVVNVYNKNNKQIFAWNSANAYISNVLVDSSGEKIAVSTISVVSGQYDNKLMIFDLDTQEDGSAAPLHTVNIGSTLPLALANTGKGLSFVTYDKYMHIDWDKFTTSEFAVSGKINHFRNTQNGALISYSLANNQQNNTVVIFSKTGEKTSQFNINNSFTDIQYTKGRIYSIDDNTICIYDSEGNVLRNGNCNYGVKKFAVISSDSIAAISDSEITMCEIEKEGA